MTEVIPEILFRSGRPGYPSRSVAEAEVAEWVAWAKSSAFRKFQR